MSITILSGSTAKYIGRNKGWETRFGKKMILQNDTDCSEAQYRFLFEGEQKTVLINYSSIEWLDKKTIVNDLPNMKLVRMKTKEWIHVY